MIKLKTLIHESTYMGSCVDVGDESACNVINDVFRDATEMAHYVGDPDSGDYGTSAEITKNDFFAKINRNVVKKSILRGDVGYFKIPKLDIYYIYSDDGIHYFYK